MTRLWRLTRGIMFPCLITLFICWLMVYDFTFPVSFCWIMERLHFFPYKIKWLNELANSRLYVQSNKFCFGSLETLHSLYLFIWELPGSLCKQNDLLLVFQSSYSRQASFDCKQWSRVNLDLIIRFGQLLVISNRTVSHVETSII